MILQIKNHNVDNHYVLNYQTVEKVFSLYKKVSINRYRTEITKTGAN